MLKRQRKDICFSIFLFCIVGIKPLLASPFISEEDLKEAKELFSGPTEEDYYRTDELLITATGSLKPVFLAPSVASVITKEEIEAMGATTLDEVLATVPGLHVSPSYTTGPLVTNYTFRGIATPFTPQTLLLVNGIPLQKLTQGRDFRFVLPVSTISRVEIVRGPGSAVHGADAFAGTINVITKDGQEIDGIQAGIRAGSFDTYNIWVQYGKNLNGWDIFGSFESLINGTDESRIIDSDLQKTLDKIYQTNASLAPKALNVDRKHYNFNFSLRKSRWTARIIGLIMSDAGVGVGAAPVLDPVSRRASERYTADLLYENSDIHPDWDVNLRVNYSYLNDDNNYILFPPGAKLPIDETGNVNFASDTDVLTDFDLGYIGNPDAVDKILRVETTALYDGFAQHKLRFSTGYQKMKFEAAASQNFGPGISIIDGILENNPSVVDTTGNASVIYAPNDIRHVLFISIQDEWTLSRTWELTAGVRYDNYSDFGSTTNPRAALVWQTRYDLSTKLLYGRAFRAPTVSELFAQNNPVVQGNANLAPETIDTLELAFDYQPMENLRFNLNLFSYEIEGLIELVADDAAGASKTYQNARDQKGHGAEFEVNWQAHKQLSFSGNSAWYKATDNNTGKVIPYSPRAQAYGNVHWGFLPNWSADVQWFWIGYRARANEDTRIKKVDDYHLTNLTLRKTNVVKNFDIALAIRNIFDADIREPSTEPIANDFPMNSRAFWIEVRAKF